MRALGARFAVTMKYSALVCAAWLFSATCTIAAPITLGTFEVLNDTSDPLFAGPTFLVTNDSALAGIPATFGDLHLVFDLLDLSTQDFLLTDALDPAAGGIDSNGLVDGFGASLLPDLSTLLDAYLTLTLLDPVTHAVLAGTVSLGPLDPPACDGCTTRMLDFRDQSTLAIQFDQTTPVPEPATLILMGGGLATLAGRRKRAS